MDKIRDYFEKKIDEISFIELKNDSQAYKGLSDYKIPYPVYTENLMKKVKLGIANGDNKEINLEDIADGIIIGLAINKDIVNKKEYKKVLNKIIPDMEKYLLGKITNFIREGRKELIYFLRFSYEENYEINFADYNYADELFRISLEEKEEEFEIKAVKILEEIIARDEKFPMSYYTLANISRERGNYIKAYILYEDAADKIDNKDIVDVIRKEQDQIKPRMLLEKSLDLISKMKYDQAENELKKSIDLEEIDISYYYLGKVYYLQGKLEDAVKEFEKCIKSGAEFKEVFQDLSICYYSLGETTKALDLLKLGLEKNKEDEHLLYNRMVINLSIGRIEKAKEDMNTLLEYGDNSEEVLNNIKTIKKQYNI